MPDEHGLDTQDEHGTYLEGPLKGQASIALLVNAKTIAWLKEVADYTGDSVSNVAASVLDEAALDHARSSNG